jgi:hypothetical protein
MIHHTRSASSESRRDDLGYHEIDVEDDEDDQFDTRSPLRTPRTVGWLRDTCLAICIVLLLYANFANLQVEKHSLRTRVM